MFPVSELALLKPAQFKGKFTSQIQKRFVHVHIFTVLWRTCPRNKDIVDPGIEFLIQLQHAHTSHFVFDTANRFSLFESCGNELFTYNTHHFLL